MKILLISTYELGHQPFGLASPAAWLEQAGFDVSCLDTSLMAPDEHAIRDAELIALYIPMHTATRLALQLLPRLKERNSSAHYACYGMYAKANADWLSKAGVHSFISGEYEEPLLKLALALREGNAETLNDESLQRLQFVVPKRDNLPAPEHYAHLIKGHNHRVFVGYTEATRGCKHRCRHCPVVPVYKGALRIVQQEIVLEDIARQVERGARHITFGDPDFFNAPKHVLQIIEHLHEQFPGVTYDVTIKVEHILKHAAEMELLSRSGCAFVTSAVETLDDRILNILDKGHTRQDFINAVALMKELSLPLSPTFIPFTPWTTREGLTDMVDTIAELDLIGNVSPVQWSIRLLLPQGSWLLEHPEMKPYLGEFNRERLSYTWQHPDRELERLATDIAEIARREKNRMRAFRAVYFKVTGREYPESETRISRAAIPYLSEPWYC